MLYALFLLYLYELNVIYLKQKILAPRFYESSWYYGILWCAHAQNGLPEWLLQDLDQRWSVEFYLVAARKAQILGQAPQLDSQYPNTQYSAPGHPLLASSFSNGH